MPWPACRKQVGGWCALGVHAIIDLDCQTPHHRPLCIPPHTIGRCASLTVDVRNLAPLQADVRADFQQGDPPRAPPHLTLCAMLCLFEKWVQCAKILHHPTLCNIDAWGFEGGRLGSRVVFPLECTRASRHRGGARFRTPTVGGCVHTTLVMCGSSTWDELRHGVVTLR